MVASDSAQIALRALSIRTRAGAALAMAVFCALRSTLRTSPAAWRLPRSRFANTPRPPPRTRASTNITSRSSSSVMPALPFSLLLTVFSLALEGGDVVLGAEAAVRAGRDELEAQGRVVLARGGVLEGERHGLDLLPGLRDGGDVAPVRQRVVGLLDVRDRVAPRVADLEQVARRDVGELLARAVAVRVDQLVADVVEQAARLVLLRPQGHDQGLDADVGAIVGDLLTGHERARRRGAVLVLVALDGALELCELLPRDLDVGRAQGVAHAADQHAHPDREEQEHSEELDQGEACGTGGNAVAHG